MDAFGIVMTASISNGPEATSNSGKKKLEGNSARDQRVKQQLKKLGWRVLTVWECELRASNYTLPNRAVRRVLKTLASTPTKLPH